MRYLAYTPATLHSCPKTKENKSSEIKNITPKPKTEIGNNLIANFQITFWASWWLFFTSDISLKNTWPTEVLINANGAPNTLNTSEKKPRTLVE